MAEAASAERGSTTFAFETSEARGPWAATEDDRPTTAAVTFMVERKGVEVVKLAMCCCCYRRKRRFVALLV
jgi:hypothetical protein